MPLVGDAFQLVLASVFEHQSRADGEIFDRGTHQNLPGAGERDLVITRIDLHEQGPGIDLLVVRRRHRELAARGLTNDQIFAAIAAELPVRLFPAPGLSARQLRRLVYG